jgi:hypothetical protein
MKESDLSVVCSPRGFRRARENAAEKTNLSRFDSAGFLTRSMVANQASTRVAFTEPMACSERLYYTCSVIHPGELGSSQPPAALSLGDAWASALW